MSLKISLKIALVFVTFLIASFQTINGQILKRVKQKVEQKIDKETDKVIDNVLDTDNKTTKKDVTTQLPSTITFSKILYIETFTKDDDKITMQYLFGDDSNIYGVKTPNNDIDDSSEVVTVVSNTATTIFINAGGLKIQQSASIDQFENDFTKQKTLTDENLEYQKTGNIKSIIGYQCDEYKVAYTIDNQTSSSTIWVSKTFPAQKMNFSFMGTKNEKIKNVGFVLEIQNSYQNEIWTMKAVKFEEKITKINTSEYQKM